MPEKLARSVVVTPCCRHHSLTERPLLRHSWICAAHSCSSARCFNSALVILTSHNTTVAKPFATFRYSLIAALIVGYSVCDSEISSLWIVAIAALVIIGLWASIPMSMAESAGLSVEQLLTPEERSAFRTKFILLCTASILGGLLLGFSSIG